MSAEPFRLSGGERLAGWRPPSIDIARLLSALRRVEGVPSYGNMALARRYGGHSMVPEDVGRDEATQIVMRHLDKWERGGRRGDFLTYLRDRYAPINAKNDPTGLNQNWLPNMLRIMRQAVGRSSD